MLRPTPRHGPRSPRMESPNSIRNRRTRSGVARPSCSPPSPEGLTARSGSMDSVTPNELARTLGISGLQFRNWLRAKKAAGHPMLAGHVKHHQYYFSAAEANALLREYRAEHGRRRS